MRGTKSIVLAALGLALGLASCDSGDLRRTPGHIYAPDMTYSRAYETYTSNPNFSDGLTNRPPVPGTIARGQSMPDHLMENDTIAYKSFTTSERFTDDEIAEGGRLYRIYCGICHGMNLDGNGPLYTSEKFAAKPANFKDAKYLHMPVGQMYAAIKYGKNKMGSYASQLEPRQRWMVIAYLRKMQSAEAGAEPFIFGMKADSVAGKVADTTAGKKLAVNTK